ncbi:MAG: GAF domain-containing protein [Anaerolineales bacterium]|nr:GAF domain-containing protein [Anaerolineales bacterium]
MLILYGVAVVALGGAPESRLLMTGLIARAAGLFALAGLVAAAGSTDQHGPGARRMRWAWGLLAAAQLGQVAGDLLPAIAQTSQTATLFAEVAYIAFFPLALAAFGLLPAASPSRWQRLTLLTDIGILLLGSTLSLWTLWVGPEATVAGTAPRELPYALLYPLADLALLLALAVLLGQRLEAREFPLVLLAASVLVVLFTDLLYSWELIQANAAGRYLLDLGWLSSYVLLALAGVAQVVKPLRYDTAEPRPVLVGVRLRTVLLAAPYVVLSGAFALLMVGHRFLVMLNFATLGAGVGGIMTLVVFHQLLTMREAREMALGEQQRRAIDTDQLAFSRRLLAAVSEAEAAQIAVEAAVETLKADLGLLALPDNSGRFTPRATRGWPANVTPDLSFTPSDPTAAQSPIAAEVECSPAARALGAVAALAAPMEADGRLLGVLAVHSRSTRRFDETARRMLVLIANQAAATLERTRLFEVTRRQVDELTVLHAVATAGAEAVDADQLIERVTATLGERLFLAHLGVMLVVPGTGLLRSHPSYRGDNEFVTPLGQGITGHVALTGQPARVADVSADPRFVAVERGTQSELCVPLRVGEAVIGVLNVESSQRAAFSEADERLLITIAQQISTALEKLRLFERLFQAEQQRAGELEAVRQASLGLTASLDLQAVLQAILQSTLRLVPQAQEAFVFLYHPASGAEGRLAFGAARARSGLPADDWETRTRGLSQTVVRTSEIILVPDLRQHPLFALAPPNWGGALAGLPLKIGGRVVGVMNVGYPEARQYSESELRVLKLLGDQAAIAIENARLFEAERAAREQAEALREVAATLNTSLDRERLLQLILEQLARVVKYDSASIMLSAGERLTLVAHSGLKAAEQTGLAFGALAHLRQVLASGQPLIIGDTSENPGWSQLQGAEYIRCWMGVPLAAQGRAIGLLNLDKETPRFYTDRDAELAAAFANQAAAAIENARLFEAEGRQLSLAQVLQAVGALLTAQMSLSEVFENIFDLLAKVVAYDSVSVQLVEPLGGMRLAAGRGFADMEVARESVRYVSEQRGNDYWLTHPVVVISDTETDPRWIPTSRSDVTRAWIGAALVVKGDLVGILTTDSGAVNAYDAGTGETVRAFANQAAVAIENARLFDASQRQTQTLAGLYDTALATGSVLETDVLLERLYRQVQQLLDPDTFVVSLYHADTEEMEVVLAIEDGQPAYEAAPQGRQPVSQGLIGWTTRHRQSLLVSDLLAQAGPVPPRHGLNAGRSWLGVPLIARDRIIGAVAVQSFSPGAFDGADRRFLESVASQVAIAAENARLYAEVSVRATEMGRLYAAAQDLGAKLEPQAVLSQLARHLTEAVSATSGYVMEANLAGDRLTVLAAYWAADALPDERVSDIGTVYPLSEYPTSWRSVAQQIAADKHSDDAHLPTIEQAELRRYSVLSAVVLPIVARGEVIGLAEVWESRRRRVFSLAERRLLQTLCQHAAGVIENARLFEATRRHADEVTTASDILHLLNAATDVRESFPAIAEAIKTITGCERISLAMLDPQQARVTIYALDQQRAELPRGVVFPIAATAAAADVLAGRLHQTPRLAAEADYPAERALLEAGFGSRVNLPLRVGNQVVGALNLVWRDTHGFAHANLPLLTQLSDAMALAIEKGRLFDEMQRRDAILEALAYASGRLLVATDPDEVIPDLLSQLGRAAGVSRACVADNRVGPEGELIARLRYEWLAPGQPPPSGEDTGRVWSYVAGGLTRWQQTLSVGRPLAGQVRDFPTAERERLERRGVLSLAMVPILCGGEWWGLLRVDDCETERAWSGADIEALKSAASAVGAFLDRQRSEVAEREQRTLAEALRDTAAILNSTLDLDEVLNHIMADVGHVVPHDSANIMMIEAGHARVVRNLDPQQRWPQEHMLALRYPVAETPNLRKMAATGRPDIIADTEHYPGWIELPQTRWIKSLVGAPIQIKGQVIGFITLDSVAPGFFRPAHAERLLAFAHQAGLAIENAQLYAAIRQHAEDLEQRVVERTRELADANRSLRELDRLKDQFISNVSHELRTPLTNIKLHLGLLEKRGPEVMERYLPTLQRETERLRRLIEDLLDLSRLQTQADPLKRELFLLDDLLSEVLTLHAARAEAKHLTLRHVRNASNLSVPVDRGQIIQVFTNLIGNAVAYTPLGGHAKVTSSAEWLGNAPGVRVWFTNNGPAIPPEDLPHLFRRFYRGRTAHDSGEPGTGLGLAICREIVERHGGQIDVESTAEQGTTFTVWLPLK